MSNTLHSLTFADYTYGGVYFTLGSYGDGSPAIQAWQKSDPYTPLTTVTVNLGAYGATPEKGCVFVKDYSENKGLAQALMDADLIRPTERVVELPHGLKVQEYEVLAPFRALLGVTGL